MLHHRAFDCSYSADRCRQIYVWSFSDQQNQQNPTTEKVTLAVQEAPVQHGDCSVLERRELARLMAHKNDESGVEKITELDFKKQQALKDKGAKGVLFGTVDMGANDSYIVRIRLDSFESSVIVAGNSIDITPADLKSAEKTSRKMNTLIAGLLGKVIGLVKPDSVKVLPPSDEIVGGYRFMPVYCAGSRFAQTIAVSFTLTNVESPNQTIQIRGGNDARSVMDKVVSIACLGLLSADRTKTAIFTISLTNCIPVHS